MGVTRRRRASRPPRASLLLAVFGSLFSVFGLVFLTGGLYIADQVGSIESGGGSLQFGQLLVGPLTMLFQGGLLTLVGGVVILLLGGGILLVSA